MVAFTIAGLMALALLPLIAARRSSQAGEDDCWIVETRLPVRPNRPGSADAKAGWAGMLHEGASFKPAAGAPIGSAPVEASLAATLRADRFMGLPARGTGAPAKPIVVPTDILDQVDPALGRRPPSRPEPERETPADGAEGSVTLH